MGLELAASCVAFADALEEVGRALSPHLNMSVGELLNHPEIDNTRFSQPAIFALQCALARMWTAWGVRPQVVLGHSVGEIAAAVACGLLDLHNATEFVVRRARLMSDLPEGGGMLAVCASPTQISSFMTAGLAIAAINGPEMIVVSGNLKELEKLAEHLDGNMIGHQKLPVSHAFHSPCVASIVPRLRIRIRSQRRSVIPLYSTVLLAPLKKLPDNYWARHAIETVQFGAVVDALGSGALVLELGPTGTLCRIGTRLRRDLSWVQSLAPEAETRTVLEAAASLWSAGCDIDPARVECHADGRAVHGPLTSFAPICTGATAGPV
jgi:acyl transferase domain-containing protein